MKNHYTFCEKNLPLLIDYLNKKYNLSLNPCYFSGIIVSDGDKCSSYQYIWQENNIPFGHGVLIYLIAGISPFSSEVRNTDKGWIPPKDWVIKKYTEWKDFFVDKPY